MRVRVLYFAALAEKVGSSGEEIELPAGALVRDLLAVLSGRHAFLRGLRGFRVAVDHRFASAEAPLAEGAEVALIPPVAGGADDRLRISLGSAPIDPATLLEAVADPRSGAVLVFLGVVRNHEKGRRVLHLEYQAYEKMAELELVRLGEELLERFPGVRKAALVHRFGDLAIGEASVGVAVSSDHRGVSFDACEWGIDTLKERVPIWKREHYEDGEAEWVRADCMGHDHGHDHAEPDEPPG